MSRTYATINNNLDDEMRIRLAPLAGTSIKDGDKQVLFHESPILHCSGLTSYEDVTEGEDALRRFEREFSWSYDNANFTDWAPLTTALLKSVDPDPAFPLWVRFRYTLRGDTRKPVSLSSVTLAGVRSFSSTEGAVTLADNNVYVMLQPSDVFKVFKLEGVNYYVKNVEPGTNVVAKFRYSGDSGRSWTQWTPLNDDNVKATRFNTIRFAKFEFAFAKSGLGSPVVYDVELVGEFQNVTCANKSTARIGLKSQCAPGDSCAADGNLMNWSPSEKECDTENKFDPYKLGGAIGFYNYLSNSVAKQWGHDVEYYRVDPDVKGTDVLLHEHQLYNVVDMQKLEASVPDNVFLDGSENKTDQFNLSLLSAFEVHITKDRFKQMFGSETRPGSNDIVYFCKLNRLFIVEKTIASRGAFNTATFYKVILKNYNAKANVNKKSASQGIQDKLLAYTKNTTLDDLFGPQAASEQTKAANKQQFAPLSKLTGITVNPQVTARLQNLLNSTLVVSKSVYVIPVPLTGTDATAVSYGHLDNEVGKGDNRAISMWFNVGAKFDTSWSYSLFDNSENMFGYKLRLHDGKLKFAMNSEEHSVDASDVRPNTWYCALVNMDQRMQELEMCLYSRGDENAGKLRSSALMLRAGGKFEIEPQQFAHLAQARIGNVSQPVRKRAEYLVTNIRLYKQVIQSDARDKVLNQHLVKDADLLLMADNGEAKIILPNMGNDGN